MWREKLYHFENKAHSKRNMLLHNENFREFILPKWIFHTKILITSVFFFYLFKAIAKIIKLAHFIVWFNSLFTIHANEMSLSFFCKWSWKRRKIKQNIFIMNVVSTFVNFSRQSWLWISDMNRETRIFFNLPFFSQIKFFLER